MTLERRQAVKGYARELAESIVPPAYGFANLQSVSQELESHLVLSMDNSEPEYTRLLMQVEQNLNANGYSRHWPEIKKILDQQEPGESQRNLLLRLAFYMTIIAGSDLKPSDAMDSSKGKRKETTQNKTDESLNTSEIIQGVLFALLGHNLQHFIFSNPTKIILPMGISYCENALVRSILETALLYKSTLMFVLQARGRQNSAIKAAFVHSLETYCKVHAQRINGIFSDHPSLLFEIYARLDQCTAELRILYSLESEVSTLPGHEFLSHVYCLSDMGNLVALELGKSIFDTISKPYFVLVHDWLTGKELRDTSQDLFVSFNTNTADFNKSIQYEPARLPAFFYKELGERMFQVGKTIIFLRKYCNQGNWTASYMEHYIKVFEQDSYKDLSRIVDEQYHRIMNRLAVVIYGQFDILSHLTNLKKYYLVQSADLVDEIMRGGTKILRERTANVSQGSVSEILSNAIEQLSAKHDPLSKRLDARWLDKSHGEYGWEVFTIDYHIADLPIASIIHGSLLQYLKMFNIMWKIRRLHTTISCLYINGFRTLRNEMANAAGSITKSLRKLLAVRHCMQRFLGLILAQLLFDVIEEGFKSYILHLIAQGPENKGNSIELLKNTSPEFAASIGIVSRYSGTIKHNANEMTLDEFGLVHADYMRKIVHSKLLNRTSIGKISNQSYVKQLYEIFDTIAAFAEGLDQFCLYGSQYKLLLLAPATSEMEALNRQLLQHSRQLLQGIYRHEYKHRISVLQSDMRADHDLKELGTLID